MSVNESFIRQRAQFFDFIGHGRDSFATRQKCFVRRGQQEHILRSPSAADVVSFAQCVMVRRLAGMNRRGAKEGECYERDPKSSALNVANPRRPIQRIPSAVSRVGRCMPWSPPSRRSRACEKAVVIRRRNGEERDGSGQKRSSQDSCDD